MKMEHISFSREVPKTTIPPMVVATLNIQSALNPKGQLNEIVMVGVLLHHNYQVDKASPKPPFEKHCCRKSLYFLSKKY